MNDISLNRNIDVFISYSSKDNNVANLVVEGLSERGVQCWKAGEYTINSGEDFRQKIADALDECKIFLIILSKNSMESPWCKIELTEALRKNKKIYSLKIDDSPIDELFEFKLGCSQTSDGTKNLVPVVENLSINVKKDRDAILEKEKSQIYSKTNAVYFFNLFTLNNVFMLLFLAISAIRIVDLFTAYSNLGPNDFYSDTLLNYLKGYIVSIIFALFMKLLFDFIYNNLVKKYVELSCASAEYLTFKSKFKWYASKQTKQKAIVLLQNSAKSGEYKALLAISKLYDKGNFVTRDSKLANDYKIMGIEAKNKFFKTLKNYSFKETIIYTVLLVFIYIVMYYLPYFVI